MSLPPRAGSRTESRCTRPSCRPDCMSSHSATANQVRPHSFHAAAFWLMHGARRRFADGPTRKGRVPKRLIKHQPSMIAPWAHPHPTVRQLPVRGSALSRFASIQRMSHGASRPVKPVFQNAFRLWHGRGGGRRYVDNSRRTSIGHVSQRVDVRGGHDGIIDRRSN
jgi:hypothetical protein